ncbi:cyclin-dependent kinase inhibitor far1 [Mortierella sp. AD094]|nr:cyclin-dependent kinase inhibitor far1 [Mortierella sp. AD094]
MDFYLNDPIIFMTGATGFIGKSLTEKVLRSLPAVKKIYLLMRVSDKKSLQSRVNEDIFGSRLFETLKSQYVTEQEFHNKVMSKVVPVQGDISLENLGMSASDIAMVQADTTVVISCAASVSFSLPFRQAMKMNCYGPLGVFKLAQEMPQLAALLHVSTSYRDVVLKTFPNTYTASKSMTEQHIKGWSQSMNLPVVIVRPSMVGASLSEPVPGWVEGMGAVNGPVAFCGLGTMQEWIGDVNRVMDLVPVDIVCNTILMAATQAKRGVPKIPVFQIGTSIQNPVAWNHLIMCAEQYWQQTKLAKIPRFSNDIRFEMYSEADFEPRFKQRFAKELEIVKGDGQTKLRKQLARAHSMPQMYIHFSTNEWFMDVSNSVALDESAPKELYSNLKDGFDWTLYMHIYCMRIHEHILRDEVDKKHIVKYSWKYQQKTYSPISNGDKATQVSSHL